jgi:hypothetical protein
VNDGGAAFVPRRRITLCDGEVHSFTPRAVLSVAERYMGYIETAMLDGRVTVEELTEARKIGERLDVNRRRGIHGLVMANVLQEVLQDGEVTDREAAYIAGVREFLERLGWAP